MSQGLRVFIVDKLLKNKKNKEVPVKDRVDFLNILKSDDQIRFISVGLGKIVSFLKSSQKAFQTSFHATKQRFKVDFSLLLN